MMGVSAATESNTKQEAFGYGIGSRPAPGHPVAEPLHTGSVIGTHAPVLLATVVKSGPSFGLRPGDRLGNDYHVEDLLGRGSEGEVYRVLESRTGIRRAAKLFFHEHRARTRFLAKQAQKLERLRHCPIVLQYHHSQTLEIRGRKALCLISELCEGHQLETWLRRQRGRRLPGFTALRVFYELVCGLEEIHRLGEYHGDVHTENLVVQPRGVHFRLKLIDFYDWGIPAGFKRRQDIVDAVRVLYDLIGGRAHYARQSPEVRAICCGLKRNLILKRFPDMKRLREHLDSFEWDRLP